MVIQYRKHDEIDRKAWDECISRSFHGSICAYSWFLDILCERWDALIEQNYESVFPLPVGSFLGREMVYLPYWAFDLGIFSSAPVTPDKTHAFLDAVKLRFPYARITLNKFNPVDHTDFHTLEKKRYELDLIKPYYKLSFVYPADLKRKLNIAMARGQFLSTGLSPHDLISFIIDTRITLPGDLRRHQFRLLRTVMAGLLQYRAGEICGLYDEHNQLSSAALLAWINNQVCLILQVTDPQKEQQFSDLFLIDRIIDKYSETQTSLLLLPDYTGQPRFPYQAFGARGTSRLEITHNRLPIPFRWLFHQRMLNTRLSSLQASRS